MPGGLHCDIQRQTSRLLSEHRPADVRSSGDQVVYFWILASFKELGAAVQYIEGAGRLQFIMADGAFAQTITVPYSKGLIATSVASKQIPELQDYFLSMDLWFKRQRHMYMQLKQCRLPGAEQPSEWPECPYPTEEERRREYVQ